MVPTTYSISSMARVSPSGLFLELNDKFCAIAQYSREEMLRLWG